MFLGSFYQNDKKYTLFYVYVTKKSLIVDKTSDSVNTDSAHSGIERLDQDREILDLYVQVIPSVYCENDLFV